ncbi:hypothetical protein [Streptomyces sp. NPDC007905]|uniref:hypothetical protein n=1 Tax=Streptomyces sp. NPDC007905 TaxID=3364788 RepID=UPI0036E2870B
MTNLASPMETTEISDTELDSVSAGLATAGSGGLCLESPIGDIAGDILAVGSTEGLTAGAGFHTTAV